MISSNIFLLILIPLITAFLIPLLDLLHIRYRKILVGIAGILEFVFSLSIIIDNFQFLQEGTLFLTYHMGGWSPSFGISLALDSLGLFFSTLVSLALLLITTYSIGFIGHHEGKYYVLLFLAFAAMQGAILTGDIFNLYVFIELLTLTSAPLVAFKRNRNSTEASIKYMFYGIIGGLCFFIGVILIYFSLGTLNMAEISSHFTEINTRMQLIIITFFLLSMLIKLGIFPFHFWLPKAHSACPSSISTLLSGLLLKVYLYIFIRIFWIVLDYNVIQEIGLADFIIYLSLTSCLLGHIFALQADDIKRMLAFSTIGHISMIVAALSLNTEAGFYGGLLHVISHFLMKSALFTGTGYLLQFTPSHNIKDLAGVGYKNKNIFISFVTASLGMIGIPPVIGFISKWYILLAFLEVNNHIGVIIIILGSLTAVVYYFRFITTGYEKTEVGESKKERHVLSVFYREKIVTLIVYIFTFMAVITGVSFKLFDLPLKAAINVITNPAYYINLVLGG